MGQGLGALQSEILETLDEAKRDRQGYRGFGGQEVTSPHGDHWPPGHRWTLPGWVEALRNTVRLGLFAYDLRASCNFLARRHGKHHIGIEPSFAASFSRAAANLIKRGLLIRYTTTMPIEDYDEDRIAHPERIHELEEGKFLMVYGTQVRFVCRGNPPP